MCGFTPKTAPTRRRKARLTFLLSDEVIAYTLAILNTAQRIRYDYGTNDLPPGYASFESGLYGEFTKPLVYTDGKEIINPNGTPLEFSRHCGGDIIKNLI